MRVVIATESYWPDVNGVANSVVQVAKQLVSRGHQPLVIAPIPVASHAQRSNDPGIPVVRLPAWSLPGYPEVRLAGPSRLIADALRWHRADVVHLASPFVVGAWTMTAAAKAGVPALAVYQTDMPGFVRAYGLGLGEGLTWQWIRHIHRRAALTLAPSSNTAAELIGHGIPAVARWGRGVDGELFHPGRRSAALRHELAPGGEVLVGYVGRLAKEKGVDLLTDAARLPGVRVVVVGDGPVRPQLESAMPTAAFLGTLSGTELATAYASLDVFVHTGACDTFGQTIQEALASGVPVIVPAAGGPPDLVQSGRTGLLVPPGDRAALTAAVATLAADRPRRTRFAAAARDSVASRDWGSVTDDLIDHYRAVIGADLPRRPVTT